MSWRRLALLTPVTVLASCAGNEPASADAALPLEPPLPMAICVDVRCAGGEVETWGTEEEWREDLVLALRDELHVAEVVFHSLAGEPPSADADLRLDIVVRAIPPREAEVEGSAAALDALAYLTIPLLPIWIRDVRKDPGVSLELTATVLGGKEKPLPRQTVEVPDLLTSYSERIPFISWATLGAIVAPPFIFKGEERSAHMESTLGERVRRLAAAQVSTALKLQEIEPELLRDLKVQTDPRGRLLSFLVEPEVGRLAIRRGSRTSKPDRTEALALGRVISERREYPLPRTFEGLLRIEATSLATSGIVRCYTIRLTDEVPRNEGLP
jgi:hypothetical protein